MSNAVRISEAEMAELRRAAELNNRSVSGQAEYWMRLGRAAERTPTMTMSRIEAALRGLQPVDPGDLDDDEHDEFLLGLAKAPLTPQGEAVYEKMTADGLGVGIADDGTVVYGPNESA
jgi:hypothetical protein